MRGGELHLYQQWLGSLLHCTGPLRRTLSTDISISQGVHGVEQFCVVSESWRRCIRLFITDAVRLVPILADLNALSLRLRTRQSLIELLRFSGAHLSSVLRVAVAAFAKQQAQSPVPSARTSNSCFRALKQMK